MATSYRELLQVQEHKRCEAWAELERRYGAAVADRFHRIAERPNLFTDLLRS